MTQIRFLFGVVLAASVPLNAHAYAIDTHVEVLTRRAANNWGQTTIVLEKANATTRRRGFL